MRAFLRILAGTAAVTLAGCTYGPDGGEIGATGQIQVVPTVNLPEPTPSDVLGAPRTYMVGPNDVLIVDVFGVEDLVDREFTVDNSGHISIPLAGTVDAAGKTPEALAALITERLRANYMRDPLVSVNVKEAVSQTVTVDGQVARPGIYPVFGDMTLMRAIASAEGLGEFAKVDDVVVLRTVNGQDYAGVYNIAAIRRGNYSDPQIFANDVVVVGDSTSLRRMRDLVQVVPAIVAPVIYILTGNR